MDMPNEEEQELIGHADGECMVERLATRESPVLYRLLPGLWFSIWSTASLMLSILVLTISFRQCQKCKDSIHASLMRPGDFGTFGTSTTKAESALTY